MKIPTKAKTNDKGLFYGFVSENAPVRNFPFEVKEVEITKDNFNQIREILNLKGSPVLINGEFVNKKDQLKDFLVKPTI